MAFIIDQKHLLLQKKYFMLQSNRTVCAIATPAGVGAISVIRLSGSETFAICDKICSKKISSQVSHSIHYCKVIDNVEIIDEVLVSVFKSPHSYTGEDTVEISCHGSVYIQQRIMELLLKNGSVLANPGEFTLRAFMNGKLDLSQAEAVADLIHSSSKSMHNAAINQMRGGFSKEIVSLRTQLLNFASLIELELDFSEEDVEFASRNDLKNNTLNTQHVIEKLIASFQYGNVIKNGVPVAIVGKPNVGKSTLLNTLLNEEKAIVSEIPGTTRDIIEDTINIQGIRFRFIDTAGIRHTTDVVESLGIERTYENVRKASIVLLLVDGLETKASIVKQIQELNLDENQKLALLINKIDKIPVSDDLTLYLASNQIGLSQTIKISAKNQENIQVLHKYLLEATSINSLSDNDIVITNVRHLEALNNSLNAGKRVLADIESQLTTDLLAQSIREMVYHLGTITGEITNDEILGNIFSKFCIGK
jgi:tRNA modification GTPase